jgi:two-component system NtrC family sensor kinase
MRELVENLRDFTRLDRNKTARFDLNKGLHNVIYIAKSVIPPRILVVEEFGQVPMIECNVSQINQVFLNLINNAAQAIAGDGSITVRSSMEGKHVRVEVTDTGSGIPADALPHIWENYFTTKASGDGTGLGLPVAKTIVEEHGGKISVSTTSAAGTTFAVLLPAGADELQGTIKS